MSLVTVPAPTALDAIIVRGARMRTDLAEHVTDAALSWSISEVTQLSLTVEDPGFKLWGSAVFELGTSVTYSDPRGGAPVPLRITTADLTGGASGQGGVVLKARSAGWWALRQRRGPLVMAGVSPSRFVQVEAQAVGLRTVVEPSPSRAQVARDVPDAGQASTGRGSDAPSSWTTFGRLASELGFYLFEFSGTLYFGRPTWLLAHALATGQRLKVSYRMEVPTWGASEIHASFAAPTITSSEDAEDPVVVSGIEVGRWRFREVKPGGLLDLQMVAPFNGAKYLVTSLELPLMGTGNMTLQASTPINPDPQPPEGSAAAEPAAAGSAARPAGSKSALDFVTVALSQQGDRYVDGVDVASSDADPTAFDPAELIQWACARVGVKFTGGSTAQIAACKAIPVPVALRTRGALLHVPGNIAISMGNGKQMLTAGRVSSAGGYGQDRPVGVYPAAAIAWTRGGLIPGLRYA